MYIWKNTFTCQGIDIINYRRKFQVAETPQNTDGFLGDMVNMMLAPVYLLDGINGNFAEDTDYLIAQKDGYFGRDCSRYHHQCPASLFAVSN